MDENSLHRSTEKFLELIRKSRFGNLKIYVGLAAGVGKSYRMLQEAHELRKNGIDVIIGYVETHGRTDTENLLKDLPVIPRKTVYYKGKSFEEFDAEAVMRRRPEVVIVDELAHTNVPGSKNKKRFQDIRELIQNGINVITAVNIQHIESLNPVVEQITGIKVSERIPDSVFGLADEVVNIDISTDELINRLKQGKIYEADKIESALKNFFKHEHLLQLRELALREVANTVGKKIFSEVSSAEQAKSEKVLVCIGNDTEKNERIIRRSARIAEKFNSRLYAIHVDKKGELENQDLKLQRLLVNNFKLAAELGATGELIHAENVADGIIEYAGRKGISKIILGIPSERNFVKRFLSGNLMYKLFERAGKEEPGFDIEILS